MDKVIKDSWEKVEIMIESRFGEKLDVQSIVFIIGLQELNKPYAKYTKDQKVEIMHIGTCALLLPFGYYQLDYIDEDGWPHYSNTKKIPLHEGENQELLLKKAIIQYLKIT